MKLHLPRRPHSFILILAAFAFACVCHAQASYPSYNTDPQPADMSGMESTAATIAQRIGIGWNIGNTMEAIGGETAWGNPKVTNDLIKLAKDSGFDAIRLPVSWDQYADDTTAKIDPAWLDRVKTVVQYCVDNGMYVVINIHWDGGWLENNVTPEKQAEVAAKQKAYWEQIATHLRDFDEHLLFAGTNEPNVENAQQMAVLLAHLQTFVDAVRSTGGKNAYRVLVVQGPSTDVEKTHHLMTTLPSDPAANRMMAEVHYYTPYNFAGLTKDESWGKMFYYWGKDHHSTTDTSRNATWGEESTVDQFFGLMKQQFVDKGIPVIIGEYAATRRSSLTGDNLALHLASRAYYHNYVTRQARKNGLVPFYWDNGGLGNNACGIFNRRTLTVGDQQTLDAIMSALGEHDAQNPDNDWASNLMERYLGTDPADPDSVPEQPSAQIDANNRLVFTINRLSKQVADIGFVSSADLANWTPEAMHVAIDTPTQVQFVSDTPINSQQPVFIRFQLTR